VIEDFDQEIKQPEMERHVTRAKPFKGKPSSNQIDSGKPKLIWNLTEHGSLLTIQTALSKIAEVFGVSSVGHWLALIR
jgi:hypothetical protein